MTTKKGLLSLCNILGITNLQRKTKTQLKELIKTYENLHKTTVIDTGKQIKYIYHCADIHIRTLDRHEEYLIVFNNLLDYLKKQEYLDKSVLVICGDIFHNKDKLISETIILFNNFIQNLTAIVDVIIIPGNHDIFTHNDRLDTITGIVSIKDYSNFHFLKWSGVYIYNNINFIVSSLLDNKFIRFNDLDLNSTNTNINICLYHGPLNGCKLDNEYSYTNSSSINVKDLIGFDYTMLGDIHKMQYLNKDKTIAYPGSLIQQNFKEDLHHGLIKWDLELQNSKFVNIENDYGYITLHLNDSDDSLNSELEKIVFPKKTRLKIIHDINYNIDYQEIKDNVSKFTNIISISKEIDDKNIIRNSIADKTNIINNSNIEYETFSNIITNSNIKDQLRSLHTNNLNKYSNESNNSDIFPWSIKTLEFTNVFIYGGDHINTIEFNKLPGIIGVLGSNAIGKSAIFNIIMYTLFGNISNTKSYSNRNIINKNSKKFNIKMTITMGEYEYIIHRYGKNKTRNNTVKSMEETLSFTQININTQEEINLTDANKVTTFEKIKETLGITHKNLFTLTNVMSYSNYQSLLNMTSSEISTIFSKLFNIEKYKEIYKVTLKEYKSIVDSINIKQSILDNIQKELKKELPYNLDDLNYDIDIVNKELELINNKINKVVYSLTECNTLLNCNTVLEKPKYTIEELNNIIDLLPKTDLSIESLNLMINDIKDKINISIGEEYTDDTIDILLKKQSMFQHKTIYKPCSKNEYLFAKQTNDNTDFNISDLINKINNDDYTKDELIFTLEQLNNDDFLEKYINSKIIVRDYLIYKENISTNKKIDIELLNINKKLNYRYIQQVNFLEDQKKYIEYNNILDKCILYEKNKEYIKTIEILKNNKNLYENERYSLGIELNNFISKKAKVELLIEQRDNYLIQQDEVKTSLTLLEKDANILKEYKNIVNDKALPKTILSNTIKVVEFEANKLIYKLSGILLKIIPDSDDTESQGAKWDIVLHKNNMILGTEHVSGYERFIIDIGIKVALDKYKYYSGLNMFFIDEAFDCIAEDNFDKIDELFYHLKKEYKSIMIISHNEELKKKIDHRIIIKSDFNNSKIK